MRTCLLVLTCLVWWPMAAAAQPEVDARRLVLGTAGTTCTLRSGSGAPATGLGAVCDVYVQTDSPYTTYVKTGASTWTSITAPGYTTGDLFAATSASALGRIAAVGTGQLLASAGSGTLPAWSASPTVTALTASGALQGATVAGTTSVTTPSLLASANLTLAPTGDVVFNPTGNDLLPTTGYDLNIGALTNKFLTLHAAELWVETLVAQNTMATIGGRILVGPTTTLTSDLAAAATSMAVKHNELASGDRVVLQANGALEWLAVTSGPSGGGPYTYSISRNQDGSGANDWTAGDAVFNSGTTGDGFIDLYSVAGVIPGSTAGPTIVGQERLSGTYSDVEARWAIGNLNGLFGYGATTYGAAFGDPTGANITIDATNGLRIRGGTTNKLTADTSGNLSIVGDLTVGTSGIIRSGATNYASGTGYVLDYNSGTPRMRVGTTAGNRLAWDGTDIELVSANATINASGIAITPSTILTTGRAYAFTTTTGDLGVYAADPDGAGRRAQLRSTWTGTGNYASAPALLAELVAGNEPSSGGTVKTAYIRAIADTSSGVQTFTLLDSDYTQFGTDFRISQVNATATTIPYMRSDGNYLVLEARPSASGGAIYLGLDNATTIVLGAGGGQTQIQTPHFTTNAPRWAAGLTQSTVGAAGAASALPSNPVAYVKIADAAGNVYIVPAYNP